MAFYMNQWLNKDNIAKAEPSQCCQPACIYLPDITKIDFKIPATLVQSTTED